MDNFVYLITNNIFDIHNPEPLFIPSSHPTNNERAESLN